MFNFDDRRDFCCCRPFDFCCERGLAGPIGPRGEKGEKGDKGDCGRDAETQVAFAANEDGENIHVKREGTIIRLSDDKIESEDIKISECNTKFVVLKDGTYVINYNLHFAELAEVGADILINGHVVKASKVTPPCKLSEIVDQFVVKLEKCSTISLELFGCEDVRLQRGAGATVTVTKVK